MKIDLLTDKAVERQASEWLLRRDAGLQAAAERELADWLAADPRHAAAFSRLAGTWTVFERAGKNAAAVGAIAAEIQGLAQKRRRRRARLAITVSLIVAAPLLVMIWPRLESSRERAMAAFEPIRKLPDGSIVELNNGAEIAVQYEQAFRRVVLVRGEAHFRVEKDPGRPFLVDAGRLEVRAVGTAFTVQLQPKTLEIVVTEGRVAVDKSDGAVGIAGVADRPVNKRETLAHVDAGEGVIVINAQAATRSDVQAMTEAQIDQRLAWRIPRLEFDNTELSEAIVRMNRQNRLQIVLGEPTLGAQRISGIFRSDNPEGFVRILEGTFNLRAEQHADQEIVLRRAP